MAQIVAYLSDLRKRVKVAYNGDESFLFYVLLSGGCGTAEFRYHMNVD